MSHAATNDPAFDIAVVGAGIVGASIACHAAPRARVLLLEAEAAPGYHSTGRSAALFAQSYGPPAVRALTRASRAFFDAPPAGFAPVPLLRARGALFVGTAARRGDAETLCATLLDEGGAAELLDADAARALVPVLRPEAAAAALRDPAAFDIDVDALLQGFLRRARAQGAVVAPDARVSALAHDGGRWRIGVADGRRFAAHIVVNAAGAWADEVAGLAGARRAGVEPRRRSAFLFDPPAGVASADWPAVIALDESWYFKPDAGLLLGSPANADPTHAHDVVAEELDVALGIQRIEEATTMTIRRPRRTWAGLRSFVADGEPVLGFEPGLPAFFWAAALGGYGIQSSPALGVLAAAWLRGEAAPEQLAAQAGEAELRRWLQPHRA
ncbi:MAG: FAD-binding oxidoreductase [Rubrivivax sp.]|nr:FAD-binding oxidoreductase [Rubrivivax sp.]